MKIKILKQYKALLLGACLFGCTNEFEEVNQNPNSPVFTTPNLLVNSRIEAGNQKWMFFFQMWFRYTLKNTTLLDYL